MLICITGIDGVGKTTLTESLVSWLVTHGLPALSVKLFLFRNPAYQRYQETLYAIKQIETNVEKKLRSVYVALETYHTIKNEVVPALAANQIVVCDRYLEGSLGYLRVRGLDEKLLLTLSHHLPKPDVVFFLDLPVEKSIARVIERDGDIKPELIPFMEATYHLLLQWAIEENANILNASLPIELLTQEMGRLLLTNLGRNSPLENNVHYNT